MLRALSEYDQSESELERKTIGGKTQETNSVLILYLIGWGDSMNFLDLSLKPFERKQLDQHQYLGNCPTTPPLTQH